MLMVNFTATRFLWLVTFNGQSLVEENWNRLFSENMRYFLQIWSFTYSPILHSVFSNREIQFYFSNGEIQVLFSLIEKYRVLFSLIEKYSFIFSNREIQSFIFSNRENLPPLHIFSNYEVVFCENMRFKFSNGVLNQNYD